MKMFFKTNLFIWLSLIQLNNLKVIHNLYSECLTQTLSKTTFFSYTEGVIWMLIMIMENGTRQHLRKKHVSIEDLNKNCSIYIQVELLIGFWHRSDKLK